MGVHTSALYSSTLTGLHWRHVKARPSSCKRELDNKNHNIFVLETQISCPVGACGSNLYFLLYSSSSLLHARQQELRALGERGSPTGCPLQRGALSRNQTRLSGSSQDGTILTPAALLAKNDQHVCVNHPLKVQENTRLWERTTEL